MRRPFPPLPRLVPLGLLGTLVLIATTEAFLARHDLRLSSMWADAWREARRAAEEPQSGGVLLLGDSQVELGISPITVEAQLRQPVRCLAVPGGRAASSYFLLRAALGAGAIPSAVVVDFEPNLMRMGCGSHLRFWSELATPGECLDLAWTMRDAKAFAQMAWAGAMTSYRRRDEIRDELMTLLQARWPHRRDLIASARRNRGMNQGGLMMSKPEPGRSVSIAPLAASSRRPWTADATNEAFAHRLLDLAAERGIPVFCALMPVSPHLRAITTASGFDAAYTRWLRSLQGAHPNLFVLDWRDAGYPDALFFDALHLDVEGAASVAQALALYLQSCYRGEGLDRRWVAMPGPYSDGSYLALEDQGRSDFIVRAARSGARPWR